MERRAKLYGAISHARMEEAQMVEQHDYPEEQLDEHGLDEAEYEFDLMQWDGDAEEEIVQEQQPNGHVIIRGQPQGEEYAEEEYSDFVEFADEEEAKRYIAKMHAEELMGGEEEMIEEMGEGPTQYINEEGLHDPSDGALFEVYQHTGRRRATIHQCQECGVVIKHPSKIAAHMRTHTGEKPFQCTVCLRRFTQRTPWRMHMKRHEEDLPFECSTGCGKRFPNKSQRNAHDLRHMGRPRMGQPRPHLKPQKTMMIVDSDPIAARFEALMDGPPVIEAPLFELTDDAHQRIDEVINAVIENRAGKRITDKGKDSASSLPPTETTIRRAKSRRAPPIVAECQICGLMLKHPSKIQAHMRSHSGVKPFKCQSCGLSVATHYALRMHTIRKHTEGERPIACTWECGRRFVSVSAKNEHERIVHAGIKRYVCSVGGCCRLFSRRTHLVSHRLKDHPGLSHVDEFGDAVDQDYLEEIRGLMEGTDEGERHHLEEEGEEGRETEHGEQRRIQETQRVFMSEREYQLSMRPSPLLDEPVEEEREESTRGVSSRPSPSPTSPPPSLTPVVSLPRPTVPSVPPQELAMPRSIPVVPRLKQMKIPRIVRPRGARMQ